jgi:8-oxo-dGTP diphosphatase
VTTNVDQNKAKSVRLVSAAFILRGDTILICQRRRGQPMELKWEFPGGKIEPGETPEQALARELEEELGIRAEIGAHVVGIRHTYRHGGAVDLQFFVVHTFQGELENRVFNDFRWVPLKSLPDYDFLAADRALIQELADGTLEIPR